MKPLKPLNLLLIFLLELAVLVAAGYWGFNRDAGRPLRILLGIGSPVVLAVLWSLLGAPDAKFKTRGAVRVLFELAWFGSGAAALAVAGRTGAALVFAAVAVVSKTRPSSGGSSGLQRRGFDFANSLAVSLSCARKAAVAGEWFRPRGVAA
ncbi:YrdB family protein [Streptomyces violascens]|uniref:YrdB family protein n=1 Tax=Streptomyces violascens TaxID=67381 RepID=UPI0037ADA162